MRRVLLVLGFAAIVLVAIGAAPSLAAASPYADAVRATPGLSGYWRLGEASGPSVGDETGAWPANAAGVTFGRAGTLRDDADTAAAFAGSGSVNAGNGPAFTGELTVEAWVSIDALRSGYLVSDGSSSTGYHLFLSGGAPVARIGMSGGTVSVSAAALSTGAWHHLAATVTATTVTLYVDGVARSSQAARGTPRTSNNALMLGRYSSSSSTYLRGALDEVAVYGAALDPATVRAHYDLAVDATPPVTEIAGSTPALIGHGEVAFAFSAAKPLVTFECRRDTGAWTGCSSPVTYTGLTDGPHSFAVRARDRWGNVDPAPPARTWTVDTGAPETRAVAILPSGAQPAGTVAFSSPDAGARFECRTDAGAWSACASPLAIAGGHDFAVRAVDAAGNADPSPSAVSVPAAAPQPLAELTAPSASFKLWTDPAAGVECSLDGGGWEPCGATVATPVLVPGPHALAVRALLPSGATQTVQTTWTTAPALDVVAPETRAMAILPSAVQPTASVAFSSPDPTAGFQCRIDAGAWSPCTSPTGAPGGHQFAVRAIDPAGNADPNPSVVTIPAPPAAAAVARLTGPSASFGLWTDGTGAIECNLDGGQWAPCRSMLTTGALHPGPHALVVRAALPGGAVQTVQTNWLVTLPAPQLVGVQFPVLVYLPPAHKISRRFPSSRLPAVRFSLNVAATVRVSLDRTTGPARGRHLATWTIAGNAGANVARVPLAIYRRLRSARYRLTVDAAGPAGRSPTRGVRFQVVRRRP
jgi:Concanavalin A-like lectin/glucanases superfamily